MTHAADSAHDDPREPRDEQPRLKLAVILPLLVFALVAAFFVWGLIKGDPRKIPSVLIGKPVPQFSLPALKDAVRFDGRPVPALASDHLKGGDIKMVNFFASWCVACRDEHPFIMQLARQNVMPIFGIAYKDAPEKSLAWLNDLGNPYERIGVDLKGRVGIDFGVYGIPETFFINADGVIIYKFIGPLSPKSWQEVVLPSLEKARKEYAARKAAANAGQ